MFDPIPSEVHIGGTYLPPALLVVFFALVVAWLAGKILNRTRLARYFWNPPLAFLAIWALVAAVIGLVILAP